MGYCHRNNDGQLKLQFILGLIDIALDSIGNSVIVL